MGNMIVIDYMRKFDELTVHCDIEKKIVILLFRNFALGLDMSSSVKCSHTP